MKFTSRSFLKKSCLHDGDMLKEMCGMIETDKNRSPTPSKLIIRRIVKDTIEL